MSVQENAASSVDGQDGRIPRWLLVYVLLLSAAAALSLVILIPPLRAADEPQHLQRAFQISEGGILGSLGPGGAGGYLPASLAEFTERMHGTRVIHTNDRVFARYTVALVHAELARPLEPDRREFLDFRGAVIYPPLAYLPQAAGIALARGVGAGPLGLLWAARLMNVVVALSVMAIALVIMPIGWATLAVVALFPATLFQFASASPDAMIISTAALFAALGLRGVLRRRWASREVVVMALAGLVFCSVRPPYAPLLLLPLALAFQPARRSHALIVQAAVLAIALGGTLLWMAASQSILLPARSGTDPAAQLRFVLTHPAGFLMLTLSSMWNGLFLFYYWTMVAGLGWTRASIPFHVILYSIFALIIAQLVSNIRSPIIECKQKFLLIFMSISSLILIFLSIFIYWSLPGADLIRGVQGRYFIPIVPFLGAAFASRRFPRPITRRVSMAVFVGLLAVLAAAAPATLFIAVAN